MQREGAWTQASRLDRSSSNPTSKGNGTVYLVSGTRGSAREHRQVRVRLGRRRLPHKSIGISVARHPLTNGRDLLCHRPRAFPTVSKHPDRHPGQVAEDDVSRITLRNAGYGVDSTLDHLPGIRKNYFRQKFRCRLVVRNAPPINDVAPQQRGNGHELFRWFADAQLDCVSVQCCITNKGQVRRFDEVLGNSTDSHDVSSFSNLP